VSRDRIVFDTEAYIAHYFEEPGADVVDDWLNQVYDGELAGFVSTTTLVEVRYIICRAEGETMDAADAYVEQLIWPNFSEDETHPRDVADIKCQYPIALGDAFALATAISKDARLIAGADDDWDEPIEDGHDIERFRTEPA
jgi:predicted nucleic acid-binding protein